MPTNTDPPTFAPLVIPGVSRKARSFFWAALTTSSAMCARGSSPSMSGITSLRAHVLSLFTHGETSSDAASGPENVILNLWVTAVAMARLLGSRGPQGKPNSVASWPGNSPGAHLPVGKSLFIQS